MHVSPPKPKPLRRPRVPPNFKLTASLSLSLSHGRRSFRHHRRAEDPSRNQPPSSPSEAESRRWEHGAISSPAGSLEPLKMPQTLCRWRRQSSARHWFHDTSEMSLRKFESGRSVDGEVSDQARDMLSRFLFCDSGASEGFPVPWRGGVLASVGRLLGRCE